MAISTPYKTLENFITDARRMPRDADLYTRALNSIGFTVDSLKAYLHFSNAFYTRNLVESNPNFEVMLLCWEPGQYTPIHDHNGSYGWLYILDGVVEETRFHPEPAGNGKYRMRQGKVSRLGVTGCSYIDDNIGYHRIANVGSARAVTLHMYSHPIPSCNYYSEQTEELRVRQMTFYSRFGTVVG